MGHSSILGGTAASTQHSGTGTAALGPSDSTDSGSDTIGTLGDDEFASDSDRHGTGERASVEALGAQSAADILPDHVERFDGLDDAEAGDAAAIDESVDQLMADEDEGDAGGDAE